MVEQVSTNDSFIFGTKEKQNKTEQKENSNYQKFFSEHDFPNMAIPAQNKNRYTLSTVSLLFLFLLSLFFFSKHALEPKLTIYRDLFTQTPVVSTLDSNSRSGLIPSASNPELDDNATTLFDNEGQISPSHVPIVPNSNLEHEISGKSTVLDSKDAPSEASISSKSRTGDDTNGTTITSVDLERIETVNERSSSSNSQSDDDSSRDNLQWKNCDFYQGTWVRDEGYPLYKPGSCPYVDEAFDCQSNGRPDSEYLKWRWKPDGCNLPRLFFIFCMHLLSFSFLIKLLDV